MGWLTRLVVIQVVMFCLLASSTAASTRSRGKKKIAKETKEVNICDIEKQQAPLYCYCDNTKIRNATDANCIVLNTFKVDDPMWNYFTSQIYIENLSFSVRAGGSLDYVPTHVLRQLKNIKVVTIQYASIHELAEHTFSNLSTVTQINLSKNTIVTLRKYAFEDMKELTMINLDENRIAEINRDIFINLPFMRTLFLNHNNISIVHDKAFKHLPTLLELELNGNQISVITRDSFHGLRNLQRLDLRKNLISMIGDRSFIEMPELQELELDQNSIEYISEKALEGMRNLRKLRLSENKLVTLEPDFLSGASGIYFLDLRDNALRTMTFDNIKPIVTNLYNATSHFYLDGNKLICDCKLAWIWGLRNETKNAKLRDALEELTCLFVSNNATLKINNDDLERTLALEIARNPANDYPADNLKDGNDEDAGYMGDVNDYDYDSTDEAYEDQSSSSDSQCKMEMAEGKTCYVKHLFELKPEELPCPEPSREDLMASEQPSSRHANAAIGSSGSSWFTSSSDALHVSRSVLVCSLVLLQGLTFAFST